MSEWSKEHAWKVCIPLKGIQGSNPCLSAFARRSFSDGGLFIRSILLSLRYGAGYGGLQIKYPYSK